MMLPEGGSGLTDGGAICQRVTRYGRKRGGVKDRKSLFLLRCRTSDRAFLYAG